jgi:hypothetical protein
MASAIEDPSSLPGEAVSDQLGNRIGEIKHLYGVGDDGAPMWVTVETSSGLGQKRLVFVPLARLKHEDGEVRVPYTLQHIQGSPEVEAQDELSEEQDRALRNYYAIGLADQEVRTDNESYAAQIPEGEGAPRRVQDDG